MLALSGVLETDDGAGAVAEDELFALPMACATAPRFIRAVYGKRSRYESPRSTRRAQANIAAPLEHLAQEFNCEANTL